MKNIVKLVLAAFVAAVSVNAAASVAIDLHGVNDRLAPIAGTEVNRFNSVVLDFGSGFILPPTGNVELVLEFSGVDLFGVATHSPAPRLSTVVVAEFNGRYYYEPISTNAYQLSWSEPSGSTGEMLEVGYSGPELVSNLAWIANNNSNSKDPGYTSLMVVAPEFWLYAKDLELISATLIVGGEVLAASTIPEPSAFAAIAALASVFVVGARRRARA